MILPNLSVGFISTLIFGSFLSSTRANHGTEDDGVVNSGSLAQLNHAARELPPNYDAPTNGYDYPLPYQYGTSTLTSVSVSATLPESIPSTVVDTTTVTTTYQSSNATISTIVSQISTTSQAFQSTDESAPVPYKTWVESSVLGITRTSKCVTSEGTTISTVSTLSTFSDSTINTEISSSSPSASGYPSTNGSIIVSSKSPANNTMTTRTMLGTTGISTAETGLVTSSRVSSEISQSPITATLGLTSNYSSFPTTLSHPTTETRIDTGPGVSSLKSSSLQSSLTWPPVFNTTSSASPIVSSTDLPSGMQTNTTSVEKTTAWPTSYSQTSSSDNSTQIMSSPTSSSVLSQTFTDGNPRTKTYFSSQWANNTSVSTRDGTIPGPTQILTSQSSMFSFPTSISLSTGYTAPNTTAMVTTIQQTHTVPLSSDISPNITSESSFSSFSSSPPNLTLSQPTNSGSSWIQSSVLGTVTSLNTWKPTVSAPSQSPTSSETAGVSTLSPPFQNSTTTVSFSGTGPSTRTSTENTTYHTPWTPSTLSLITPVTSIAWSSSQAQPSQHNSTESSGWITHDPQTSSQSSRITYQSSSVLISTGFTSGFLTTQSAFNSTYHWPTTIKSSVSSVQSSISTDYASSSDTSDPSGTRTMFNSTSVQTLSRTWTSTMQQWPNSTFTLLPSVSPTISSTLNVNTSFTSPTSGTRTNTSYIPPSTLWSVTTTEQTTIISLVTSRRINTTNTEGDPRSTTPGTTTATNETTLTQVPTTTLPTSTFVPSVTTGLNSTSGRKTFTSSVTGISSETILWPTTARSTEKTVNQTPSSQPASTQASSATTSIYLSNSITPTTMTSSAPVSTSTTTSRCVRKKKTKSPGLDTTSRTAIESDLVLTTLKTLVSTEKSSSESHASDGASSTNSVKPQATPDLLKNPNFPWGGDSPIHRHQSVDALGAGIPKESLWTRWAGKVKDKMRWVRL
ncbi:hypothetical protein E4U21_005552 [Claviceps maximensis]|nr:hypothetical protein E4U21_005552 [Claviceps maximensis]